MRTLRRITGAMAMALPAALMAAAGTRATDGEWITGATLSRGWR